MSLVEDSEFTTTTPLAAEPDMGFAAAAIDSAATARASILAEKRRAAQAALKAKEEKKKRPTDSDKKREEEDGGGDIDPTKVSRSIRIAHIGDGTGETKSGPTSSSSSSATMAVVPAVTTQPSSSSAIDQSTSLPPIAISQQWTEPKDMVGYTTRPPPLCTSTSTPHHLFVSEWARRRFNVINTQTPIAYFSTINPLDVTYDSVKCSTHLKTEANAAAKKKQPTRGGGSARVLPGAATAASATNVSNLRPTSKVIPDQPYSIQSSAALEADYSMIKVGGANTRTVLTYRTPPLLTMWHETGQGNHINNPANAKRDPQFLKKTFSEVKWKMPCVIEPTHWQQQWGDMAIPYQQESARWAQWVMETERQIYVTMVKRRCPFMYDVQTNLIDEVKQKADDDYNVKLKESERCVEKKTKTQEQHIIDCVEYDAEAKKSDTWYPTVDEIVDRFTDFTKDTTCCGPQVKVNKTSCLREIVLGCKIGRNMNKAEKEAWGVDGRGRRPSELPTHPLELKMWREKPPVVAKPPAIAYFTKQKPVPWDEWKLETNQLCCFDVAVSAMGMMIGGKPVYILNHNIIGFRPYLLAPPIIRVPPKMQEFMPITAPADGGEPMFLIEMDHGEKRRREQLALEYVPEAKVEADYEDENVPPSPPRARDAKRARLSPELD
jgi:hypothetical protein